MLVYNEMCGSVSMKLHNKPIKINSWNASVVSARQARLSDNSPTLQEELINPF